MHQFLIALAIFFLQADENMIGVILADKNEINHRVFDSPLSVISYDGKKINYFKFLSECKFDDCNNALKRIASRINLNQINKIIENTPAITEKQKAFYKTIVKERKEQIIDFSLEKLKEKELD